MKTWAYLETNNNEVNLSSWEALALASSFGASSAILIGSNVEKLISLAFEYGAESVAISDHPNLIDFRSDQYASILAEYARAEKPDLIIFPNTFRSRELAAMLSIDLECGIMVDITALEEVEGTLIATRPIYEGKALEKINCSTSTQLLTIRSRAFPMPAKKTVSAGSIIKLSHSDHSLTKVEATSESEGGVSLANAKVIVSAGRGITNNPKLSMDEKVNAEEGLRLVKALADRLGGAIGASRAIVDGGYLPYSHQVGQTGKVVSPDLYISAGISGSIQHMVGMRSSKLVLSINKDPEAPIFEVSDIGIVGDLFDYLPLLTDEFKRSLGLKD